MELQEVCNALLLVIEQVENCELLSPEDIEAANNLDDLCYKYLEARSNSGAAVRVASVDMDEEDDMVSNLFGEEYNG